jgi:hypothetical protein
MEKHINEADVEFLKFDLELARRIGVSEAIVFERIRHWCRGSSHVINGQRWIYNSFEDWKKQLPFSLRTIKTLIARLEQLGLINVSEFNQNRYRRPNWYSVNLDVYQTLRLYPIDSDTLVGANFAPSLQRGLSETLTPEREDLSNMDFRADNKEPLMSESVTGVSASEKEEEGGEAKPSLSGESEADSDEQRVSKSDPVSESDEDEHDWETFKRLEKDWMERVKSTVLLEGVAMVMGVEWDADGKVICHGERTASLDIGVHNKQFEYRWFCFGECHGGGDQFDFVMKFGNMNLDKAVSGWIAISIVDGQSVQGAGDHSPRSRNVADDISLTVASITSVFRRRSTTRRISKAHGQSRPIPASVAGCSDKRTSITTRKARAPVSSRSAKTAM